MNYRRVIVEIAGERGRQEIMVKRREGVKRYQSDGSIVRSSRGETEEQAMATAMAQRLKVGATVNNFRAHEWESPLGQFRMRAKVANDEGEGLSARQYDALKRYILARHLYRSSQGFPAEHPKSIASELVARGIDVSRPPDDEDTAMRKASDYNGARSALLSDPSRGIGWCRLADAMAKDEAIDSKALGELRMAANVLARYFGM